MYRSTHDHQYYRFYQTACQRFLHDIIITNIIWTIMLLLFFDLNERMNECMIKNNACLTNSKYMWHFFFHKSHSIALNSQKIDCIDRLWQAFASETYYCYINKVSVNVLPVNGWNKGNRHIDTSTTFNIMYITYSARLTLFTERNSKLQYTKIIHYELWFKVMIYIN